MSPLAVGVYRCAICLHPETEHVLDGGSCRMMISIRGGAQRPCKCRRFVEGSVVEHQREAVARGAFPPTPELARTVPCPWCKAPKGQDCATRIYQPAGGVVLQPGRIVPHVSREIAALRWAAWHGDPAASRKYPPL